MAYSAASGTGGFFFFLLAVPRGLWNFFVPQQGLNPGTWQKEC